MNVKICGITRYDDGLFAVQQGAWALGFVFYKKSPRYIDPLLAKTIIKKIRKNCLKDFLAVGVFVDEPIDSILKMAELTEIDCLQLHGNENKEYMNQLNRPFIKAIRPRNQKEIEELLPWENDRPLLVDAFSEGQHGGTGKLANWELAKFSQLLAPVILSGGLNADNIVEAIKSVQPAAVDLSSGVEKSPGVKDKTLIQNFFKKLEDL